jgi:hypothetical protein
MKIKAYRLYEHAVALQPAPPLRAGGRENASISANVPVTGAGSQGWNLLCPLAFEATWNGGPRPEDIGIRWEGAGADLPDFVQSQLGEGRLTFYPGYQFKTEAGYVLWVRGPINALKDGLAPLEQILDTSLLPGTVTVHWQFTRPQQTIRFEAGEPFAVLMPYAPREQADTTLEVIRPQDDVAAYEQAVQQMLAEPALQEVLSRLDAATADPTPPDATGSSEPKRTPGTWAAQLTNPPPVSCICPTYGRVELLEEAIYSFLQQDYAGQKELIVLNDYERQTLAFDHPEVRIINLPKRFNSVGEKYKAAAALASHDLIFVWHDDDIYLPHRLSYAVAHLNENTAFFKADQAWFWNKGQVSGPERNVFHGGSCWRRDLLSQVHGYPHIGNHYDIEFERLCKAESPGALRVDSIKPEDIYYIYRWAGTGSYHLSAMGADGQEHQKVAAYVEQQAAHGQIPHGEIRLQPQWKADYGALVQNYLATLPAKADAAQAMRTGTAQATHPLLVSCFDTIDGRIDLQQFEPGFFFPSVFLANRERIISGVMARFAGATFTSLTR